MRECRKVQYRSLWDAQRALAGAQQKRRAGLERRREVAHYWCSRCFHYHLTSMAQHDDRVHV